MKFDEKDGIEYAAVTVQLPGGERVPFLFTVKQLVASGKPERFSDEFLVPRGDEEELAKENVKNAAASKGKITLTVTKSKPETGEEVWYAQLD
ncbi:unnamed protein product [Linum trigynum]|uniref:Uncharacterized protein n=1 Tax=Linum trigynum TaxID=586398 RepID=A0AAV2GKV8_9ROSI